jgi:hypothetical protein
MAKTFILHDESVNTFGFWAKTAGIDLSQFKKNPMMYFMHIRPGEEGNTGKDMILPIGHWENIRVEGDKILADPVFDLNDPFAKRIADKVEKGDIRMASMGLGQPWEFSANPADLKEGQTRPTLIKCMGHEASIADRGSNQNALKLYNEDGQMIALSQDPTKCAIPLIKQSNKSEMKTVLGLLKLADTANEAEAYQAIVKLNEKQTALEGENTKLKEEILKLKEKDTLTLQADIKNLIDGAVKDRKILEKDRATFVKLAEGNFENAKAAIDAMPVMTKLTDQTNITLSDKYKDKGWDELDKLGNALPEIKLKDPARYKELFKEKFGKEPNA